MLAKFNRPQFIGQNLDELARSGNALANSTANALQPVLSNPRMHSVTQSVTLTTLTNNVVNHKLGRQPQGWAILDDTGGGIVRKAWTPTTITLYSPATCSVSLEVW